MKGDAKKLPRANEHVDGKSKMAERVWNRVARHFALSLRTKPRAPATWDEGPSSFGGWNLNKPG
jgi:hypothetical protein